VFATLAESILRHRRRDEEIDEDKSIRMGRFGTGLKKQSHHVATEHFVTARGTFKLIKP
jgi:hypothetical protein